MSFLTDDQKKALEKEYFLIGRRTFWGGAITMLVALGVFSFATAKAAVEAEISKFSTTQGFEKAQ